MIETDRLILRPFREGDASDVLEYAILKKEWEYTKKLYEKSEIWFAVAWIIAST